MSRWRDRGAAARAWSAGDWAFLARAGATAVAAGALLRVAPLPWVARGAAARWSPLAVPTTARQVRLTDQLLAVDVGPVRPNCVVRSLILLRYLPGDVVFKTGIRPGVRPVDGHAWVEADGEPVAEAVDPRAAYTETWRWRR